MASITRTKTFETGQQIDRQDIADLIEDALLSNLGLSDLGSTALGIVAQSEPPGNPNPGQWWYDQTEQLMKHYDAEHGGIWLAIGPDRKDMAMRNFTGDTRTKGDHCVHSYGIFTDERQAVLFDNGNLASSEAHLPIGTWADTTASGQWGPVSFCGLVWARIGDSNNPAGASTISVGDFLFPAFDLDDGAWKQIGQGDPTDRAPIIAATSGGESDTILGMWVGHRRG